MSTGTMLLQSIFHTYRYTHFEVVYEFEIGELPIGPVAEYAWSPNDAHAMLGLHIGCGF